MTTLTASTQRTMRRPEAMGYRHASVLFVGQISFAPCAIDLRSAAWSKQNEGSPPGS